MAVQPFQFTHQGPQVGAPFRDLQVHQLFDRLHECRGVGVGTDAADALEEVDALVVVPRFAGLFNAPVVVPDVHAGADNLFAADVKVEFGGFLEQRVLGPERYTKSLLFHATVPPSS
jgi:hypothetical protein